MRQPDRGRFYQWLPLLIVLLTAVTVGIGIVALRTVEQRLVQRAGNSMALAAADIADKLDLLLFERYGDIQMMAQAAVFQGHDGAAMTDYLHAVQRAYPVYLWLAVTDARGVIVAATDPFSAGKDRSGEPWFQAVREAGGIHVQDAQPSAEAGRAFVVAFTAPIRGAQREFRGAVTAQVGLPVLKNVFERTVHPVELEPETPAPIEWQFLNRDGEVLVDSARFRNRQEGRVNLKRLGLTSARLISFSSGPGYVEERHLRRPASVVTGFAQTKGMRDFPGLHWGILVRIDRADILAPVHRIMWKVGTVGGVLFLPMLGLLYWTTGRLRLEWAQAHESKTWLFTTLKSIGDAVIATDTAGCVVFMNGVAESLTGWNEGDAKGQALEAVFHIVNEETRLAVENPVKKVLREGRILGLANHTVLIAKDGTERPIEDSGAPIRDAAERIVGVVLVFRDITDSKQARETVQRLGQKYQLLLDSAGEGIYGVDLAGTATFVNPAAATMLGYTVEELIGRPMHALFHHTKPDGTPYPRQGCQIYASFEDGLPRHVTGEVFWRKDGTCFPVEYTSTPIREHGRIVGAAVTFLDITARKAAEEALQRAEAKYRDIFENAVEGIFQSSPDGRYLNANPTLARMYGYDSPEDLIAGITNIEHQVYVAPSRRQEFIRLLERDHAVHGFEAQVYRKDGSMIWISEHARAVRDDRGTLLYFEGTIEDVTERKRAEEALRDTTNQLRSITEAMVTFLESENWREASTRLLRSALSQTGSEFGFMGVVVEGPTLRILAHEGINWDPVVNRDFYDQALHRYREAGYLEFTNLANLFGSVITGGKTVRSNDPGADPRAAGLPPGHPALRNFLGVPIRRGAEVVGMIGIANRPGGYTGTEEAKITILTETAGVLYDSYRRKEREATSERQRKQAEEQLTRSHEQLRRLAAHLESVREEERIGIAREIHDELGLALTVLKMDLVWIGKRVFSEDLTAFRTQLLEKIQSITKRVDDTVRSVQKISSELRPDVLDHLGLVAAIEWQARDFQTRMGLITCEFTNNPDQIPLDRDRATAMFRIFQGILTNVARHAAATRVDVRLYQAAGHVVLEVKDNGKGITEAEITSPKSLGLVGMRERVLRWGGEVRIRGVRQQGTTVTVRLPLPDREPGREE